MERASQKPTHLAKGTDVKESSDESPSAFLDAYLLYTPIDPEDLPNFKALNLAFVSQSAPDMRTKIQKMDVFTGKNRSALLEISQKVFDDRDSKEDLVNKMGCATMAALQAAAAVSSAHAYRDKRRRPLLKDQCTYCKEMGHWKSECPYWKQVDPQPKAVLAMVD